MSFSYLGHRMFKELLIQNLCCFGFKSARRGGNVREINRGERSGRAGAR